MTVRLCGILCAPAHVSLDQAKEPWLSHRVGDIMTLLGFVGAITIGPSKVGVLYAFFLMLAIFAFHRFGACSESSQLSR